MRHGSGQPRGQICLLGWILLASGCGIFGGSTTTNPTSDSSTQQIANTDSGSHQETIRSPIHFQLMANTGIHFRHESGNSAERPFPAANGSGIGAIDYDLDGYYDLYFATGRPFPIDAPDESNRGNRLFRNGGNWSFNDVTGPAGVGHIGYSAGVAVGDFDSDGHSDIYVTCFGPNVLYRNNGDGTFYRTEARAGVDDSRLGTSAAFLDYDGDGDLDLYVCNYAKWSFVTNQYCGNHETQTRIFCNPNSVEAESHVLYQNEGDGTFHDSSQAVGVATGSGRGQGVVTVDIDLDGMVDIYVANDLQPNFLFRNTGSGSFEDISEESGAAFDKAGHVHAGMGVDAADLNRDDFPELFVTNFEQEYNTCYENQGQASFLDVSEVNGLAAASRPWVGWGTALVDFDSDGLRDIIVTNGHTDENLAKMGRDSEYKQPPLVWRNLGKRFTFVGDKAGEYFLGRFSGRALSIADLDNDGDFDVTIGHQDQPPAALCNDSLTSHESRQRTLTLKLIGRSSARDVIGATVRIESGSVSTFHQIRGGGSYLSAHDLRIIGVCGDNSADVHIRWPSGIESKIMDLAAGKEYVLIEPRDHTERPYFCEVGKRLIADEQN